MKFSVSVIATLLILTSATRLCDKLIAVKSDLSSLQITVSSNITSRAALNSAYMSLTDASTTLNSLNTQITQTTSAIDSASSSLAKLDIQTGCWLGWLENLEQGLQQVSSDLNSIYQQGASDFQNGNVKSVQGYASQIKSQASDALTKLTSAQSTLNQYNANVLCW